MTRSSQEPLPFREFLYIDREKVEDFVSAAIGGLPQQEKESTREASPRWEAGASVKVVEGKVAGGGREMGWEEIRSATHAYLFELLRGMLVTHNELYFPGQDRGRWDELSVGAFIESSCGVELSALERLFDLIRRFHRLMAVISPEQAQDRQWLQIIEYLQVLDQEGHSYNVRLVPTGQPKAPALVAGLAKRHVRGDKADLTGDYTVLGRIQRKLQPGGTVDLFNLLPEGFRLTTEQVRDFLSSFKDMPPQLGQPPSMNDLRVSYPAIVLTPIAIYR